MARRQWNITVKAYCHGKDGGMIDMDTLTPEQKRKAATELKKAICNAYTAGKFLWEEAEE